jgi:hypothetical protein
MKPFPSSFSRCAPWVHKLRAVRAALFQPGPVCATSLHKRRRDAPGHAITLLSTNPRKSGSLLSRWSRIEASSFFFHIYGMRGILTIMKQQAVRTTVDIPTSLYRRLKQQAAAQGRSVRELILAGARSTLLEGKRPRTKRVRFPLIVSKGPRVDLTNEHIYEHIEFP